MQATVKAVVFRTAKIKATKDFFENVLNLKIKEMSPRHFVIYRKGVRLVFIESPGEFEIEIYITNSASLKAFKDPNGITIITA